MGPLAHKEVRDLYWALLSPDLLSLAPLHWTLDPDLQTKLLELDQNPAPLKQFLESQPSTRLLGKYFEQLISFWLEHVLNVQSLHRNVQIQREDKTSLGELDFIFRAPRGPDLLHVEAAVKFYLLDQDGLFKGPNARDRLDLKIEKLVNHQLTLPKTNAAKKTLRELGLPDSDIRSSSWIKGMLFYPLTQVEPQSKLSLPISENHLRGYWTRFESTDWATHFKGTHRFAILEKLDWLSGSHPGSIILDREELLEWAKTPKNPTMIEILGGSHERARLFFVDPLWPNLR